MRLVELSRGEHAGLRIRADRVEACASRQHLIPIVVSEFRKAAIQYPIVFAKHPETGRFAPYVLSGLGLEENLFWTGTELDVAYVPLNVRRQPFYVGTNEGSEATERRPSGDRAATERAAREPPAGGSEGTPSGGRRGNPQRGPARESPAGSPGASVLCIDLDSPCLDGSGEKTIVNADGSDSVYLQEILAILGELVAGRQATGQFITTLLSLDLLAPMVLDLVLDDGTPLQVAGLYGLDEDRFKELDAGKIGWLRQTGSLDLIYAVLIASGQVVELIRLKNQRIALRRAWQSHAG